MKKHWKLDLIRAAVLLVMLVISMGFLFSVSWKAAVGVFIFGWMMNASNKWIK